MFDILVIIPFILSGLIFVFVFTMLISPKFRGKIMSRQVKAMKYMVEESKEDFESISTNTANASKEGIKIVNKAKAEGLKAGFTDRATIYCKHCGAIIDADSKFCKLCGKEQ